MKKNCLFDSIQMPLATNSMGLHLSFLTQFRDMESSIAGGNLCVYAMSNLSATSMKKREHAAMGKSMGSPSPKNIVTYTMLSTFAYL